jgi:hypothetical protein
MHSKYFCHYSQDVRMFVHCTVIKLGREGVCFVMSQVTGHCCGDGALQSQVYHQATVHKCNFSTL